MAFAGPHDDGPLLVTACIPRGPRAPVPHALQDAALEPAGAPARGRALQGTRALILGKTEKQTKDRQHAHHNAGC